MLNVGWRFVFYVAGALGLALALVFHLLVVDRPEERRLEPTATPWKTILANDQLWRLTTISFLAGYVVYIYFFWFYLYLVDGRGFTLLRGASYAALPFVSMVLGSLVGGVVTDRAARRLGRARARRRVALTGLFCSTLFLANGALATDAYVAIASLSVAAGLLSMVPGIAWAAALEIDPGRAATVLGIIQTGASLGGVLSPILTPWIAARYGWASALGVGAAASLTAAVLWALLVEPGAQPTTPRPGPSRLLAHNHGTASPPSGD
jgi:ACS family glucarate transporter-like MFS transporter